MLHLGRRSTGVVAFGSVVEEFADTDAALGLHALHVLVDQLLDDERIFHVFQLEMRRTLIRGMDDDRAHAEDALAKRDMDADVAHTVEQHLFHLHVQHPGL